MGEVKEFLLQFLIASLPAFLFPLTNTMRLRRSFKDEAIGADAIYRNTLGFTLTCASSMILCSLFSPWLWGTVHLNFAILPLFALMLYSRMAEGVFVASLHLLLYPVFAADPTFSGFILDTGLLLFPLLLFFSKSFNMSDRKGKVLILSLFLFVGQLMITFSPYMTGGTRQGTELFPAGMIALNIILTLSMSTLFVIMIEHTYEKEKLRMQVMQLSRNYFREAEKLQQMMDAAPLSIILLDRQGDIMTINETFLQLVRRFKPQASKEDQILGPLAPVMTDLGFEVLIERAEQSLEEHIKTTELLQSGDKTYFTSTSPIKKGHSDETIGAVLIIQDITELETFRKELNHVERLSLVGQMAAGITHEIRNPMAVVRGFLQLMQEKSPPTLDNYYRIVMEELDRANSIINDFLSLAQNRSVRMELCNLHDIVRELTPLLWADANLRGQSIEVRLDEELPDLLLNQKEIKQLILNLGRNGMEAMGDKGELMIETRKVIDGVELSVKDQGPGIPAVQQERLFEPFFTTKSQGTGLGLALCLSIMERHSGKISVHSEEGTGTVFTVFFPCPENIES